MSCFDCGNCQQEGTTYYCTAKNEFMIREQGPILQKEKASSGWKKGDPQYEKRRRNRKEAEAQKIG